MSIPERHRDATQGKRLGKFPEERRDRIFLMKLPGQLQPADVPLSPP